MQALRLLGVWTPSVLLLTTLFSTMTFSSCAWQENEEEDETGILINGNTPIKPPSTTKINIGEVKPGQDVLDEEGGEFVADLTITLGTHRTGVELFESLEEKNCRISKWSVQALLHPDFPVTEEEQEVDVIVMTLLNIGFSKDELVTLETILKRARELGLEICTPELAVQLRLQFVDQPDWSTGDHLGEFFVASEAINLYDDGIPKIFSVIRDDDFPHKKTGVGLWLISNNVVDAADENRRDRLFNPSDEGGDDLSGRFAFIIPTTEDEE